MKKKIIMEIIAVAICSMLAITVPLANINVGASEIYEQKTTIPTQVSPLIEQYDNYHGDETGSNFWQCMVLCGLPYTIIVAALAFAGQGMPAAQALLLAGATAAMIGCVLNCLGNGDGSSQMLECGCHEQIEQINQFEDD